jgi:hypothetical protein
MMIVAQQPLDTDAAPSSQSLRALDAVNFFVGGNPGRFWTVRGALPRRARLGPKGYWLRPDPGRCCRVVGAIPRRGVT